MKILICVDRLDRGGAEHLGCRLAVRLNRLPGVEAHLACRVPFHAEQEEAARKWKRAGVPGIHRLDFGRAYSLPAVVLRFRRLCRQERFDVIETSATAADIVAGVVCRRGAAAHVKGLHDYFEPETLARPVMRLWRKSLHKRQFFYAVSRFAAERFVRDTGVASARVRVIYNAVEKPPPLSEAERAAARAEVRRELGLPSNAALLLSVGRLLPRKGQDTALQATAPLLKQENAWLLFAGTPATGGELTECGATDFLAELKEAAAAGAAERVRFLGFRRDVHRLMSAADCLLHLARHEAFGLVAAEAFAADLPVVVSDRGGLPEVVEGTEYRPVPPEDFGRVRKELQRVLHATPSKREKMLAVARRRLDFFSEERRTAEMLTLFEEAVQANGSRHGRPNSAEETAAPPAAE